MKNADKSLPPLAIAWCVSQGATFSCKGGKPKDNQPYGLPTLMPEDPEIKKGLTSGP